MKESLIIGGGLSGLSLALRLRQKGHKITLLEKRETYLNDRTWCFWNTHSHPFEKLIEFRWNKWQIAHGGKKKSYTSKTYQYQMIPSLKLYQAILDTLHNDPHVSVVMGVEAHEIQTYPDYLTVQTSKGVFKGELGFDSRPTYLPNTFSQHFFGWHIRTPTPSFDPSEIILMDFDVDQSKGIHFMYLLPFSPYEALIEPTFLSAKVLEKSDYEASFKEFLLKRYGVKTYEIVREEKGVLPLTADYQASLSPRLTYIGAQAGWTRSSTGYAFLAIQEALDHLIEGASSSKRMERWLDRIFLSYLKKHPIEAPYVFTQLFEKNEPDALIRFLSGKSSLSETVKVISSCPKWPFLKEVFA